MDTFRSRDLRVIPQFDVSHTSSPESTPNYTKWRARILIVSSSNWAPGWQRWRVQRPIGAREASPQWWQLSRLQAATIPFGQWEKPNTIEILSRTTFLQVNWMRSPAREAIMDATRGWQRRLSWLMDPTLSTRQIEYHSYKSIERDHQSENLQSMTGSYPWIGNTENRRRSQQTIARQRIVYTYSSSNLEEARRTVKTTKAIGLIPTIQIPGNQNRSSPIAEPVEAAVPTIISAVALKGSLRKPKGKLAMHSLRQRRPHNLICNLGWDTSAPNRLKIKSHAGRSGSDVKPISMWHTETWFGAYHPWSPCMKYTQQHVASQSTNRLRCNEHLYIPEPT